MPVRERPGGLALCRRRLRLEGASRYAHGAIAAMAREMLGRPVKLAVTRPQTFTAFGGRPATRQTVRSAPPRRQARVHRSSQRQRDLDRRVWVEPLRHGDRIMYATPNFSSRQSVVPVNTVTPGGLRAPGENPSAFAIECAIDELAYESASTR